MLPWWSLTFYGISTCAVSHLYKDRYAVVCSFRCFCQKPLAKECVCGLGSKGWRLADQLKKMVSFAFLLTCRLCFLQEDLSALQVPSGRAHGDSDAPGHGEDRQQTHVWLPEELHLGRWLGLRARGVRLGPTRAEARTGSVRDVRVIVVWLLPLSCPSCLIPAEKEELTWMVQGGGWGSVGWRRPGPNRKGGREMKMSQRCVGHS